jgi:hypothetical protein
MSTGFGTRWRLALGAAAGLFLVLAAPAFADVINGGSYRGTPSDSSRVSFKVSANGNTIEQFRMDFYGLDCGGAAGFGSGPTNATGFSLQITPGGQTKAASTAGYYGQAGAMAGSYLADPIPGTGCAPLRVSYIAVEAASVDALGPGVIAGGIFVGDTTSHASVTKTGDVTLTMSAEGNTVARLSLMYREGVCDYPMEFTDIPLQQKKMFMAGLRTAQAPTPVPSVSGVVRDLRRMSGGFSHPGINAACGPVAGRWSAVTSNTGVPAPAASVQATFAATPRFGGGQALAIFNGGTSAQLEAAAKLVGAKGVWVQDPDGGFALLVVGGPAFLKDQFDARFPKGLPNTLPVTLTQN